MKLLHQCLVLGAIASLATSCSQEAPWSGSTGEEGKISLKLKTDLSVATSTRANDSESPVRPDGERFKIRLESADGSYAKEWENLNKFNAEEGFPRGNYTVTASYGSENEQGFKNPYYVGTQDITVKAGETTEHSITATLANSMVSIRYTDSFINYFNQYYATVESSGLATPIVFARDEKNPCYVKPGEVTVNFNISNTEGQEVTVSPATFTAQPRRHYIVTANVKETEVSGLMALAVEFQEDVDAETFDIILSDELYTAPAPEIKASGFNFGQPIDTYESVPLGVNPEFHVIAYGGIKEAKFTVQAPSDKFPKFGAEIDLANADAINQQLVEQSKLKCYGFFRQPTDEGAINQMGVVNMKEFIENLQPGEYTFSLAVTDGLGRTTEADIPYKLIAKVNPTYINLTVDEANPARYDSNQVSVIVSISNPDAKDILSFNASSAEGSSKEAPIEKVEEIEPLYSEYPYTYRFTLGVDKINDTEWNVKAIYPNKETLSLDLPVVVPNYTFEVDAFARRLLVRIIPDNPEDLKTMVNGARFYKGNSASTALGVARDENSGIITITGLDPKVDYSDLAISYSLKTMGEKKLLNFIREEELDIVNGDFTSASETLNITGLQVGGKYNVAPVDYTLKSSIKRSTPDSWATINEFTCWTGSSNKNTWFLVPSTYEEGGKVTIRNVGYNHNGTTPSTSGGAFNTKYYCENAPADQQLNKAAGELFLGKYSYDGTVHREDGISFSSRPSYIEFDYEYKSVSKDNGEMEVKILDASKNIIAEGGTDITDSGNSVREKIRVPITGYAFMDKAAYIQVKFRSSNADVPPIEIPSGAALNEGTKLGNHTIGENAYHAVAFGSILVIDNVHLGYE